MSSTAPAPVSASTADRPSRLRRALARIVWRDGGADLMELALIAAIATVLGVRFYLAALDYPQVGGGGLHIAHVLWGGLLLLVAVLLLLGALGASALRWSALIGGAGFGLFIDEVGKFVTADVDYFYQPAVAIIYVVFVALALTIVGLRRAVRMSPRTALANALELTDRAIHDPTAGAVRRRALGLLEQADPSDPLTDALRRRIVNAGGLVDTAPNRWVRLAGAAERLYRRLVQARLFQRVVIWVVVLLSAAGIVSTLVLVVDRFAVGPRNDDSSSILQVGASVLVALFALYGAWRLRRDLLAGYRWLRRAVLVNLLVVQVFNFYDSQLAAVIGVAINLVFYSALRYAIAQEQTPSGTSVADGALAARVG